MSQGGPRSCWKTKDTKRGLGLYTWLADLCLPAKLTHFGYQMRSTSLEFTLAVETVVSSIILGKPSFCWTIRRRLVRIFTTRIVWNATWHLHWSTVFWLGGCWGQENLRISSEAMFGYLGHWMKGWMDRIYYNTVHIIYGSRSLIGQTSVRKNLLLLSRGLANRRLT